MFFDDAKTVSRELELTLTGRDCGEAERAPMCGVPYHSAESYIGRLIAKGYKVAICEQTEDPALAKGLVTREVVRVITPGTLIETDLLSENKNNYLCAICFGEFSWGVCFADVSTAQIYATSFEGDNLESRLINELGTYAPSEVITNMSENKVRQVADFVRDRLHAMISAGQPGRFEYEAALERVKAQFETHIPEDTLRDRPLISAVGALLDYIAEMQKKDISYIKELNLYTQGQYLEMDVNTRRNLELCETMRTKEKRGSLLWVLDKTRTAPGARLLRKWLEHPLLNVGEISRRHSAV
jgi:DNA mismatch repair protein MutS